jgi:hypothetical protein
MRLPISEFRRRLPALVRELQRDPTAYVQITVREEAVAELRSLQPAPAPGEAARRLLALERRMRARGTKSPKDVSQRADEYLYDIER